MWNTAINDKVRLPNPKDCGWILDDKVGYLVPKFDTRTNLKRVKDFCGISKCTCGTGQKAAVCSGCLCVQNGLQCNRACGCKKHGKECLNANDGTSEDTLQNTDNE